MFTYIGHLPSVNFLGVKLNMWSNYLCILYLKCAGISQLFWKFHTSVCNMSMIYPSWSSCCRNILMKDSMKVQLQQRVLGKGLFFLHVIPESQDSIILNLLLTLLSWALFLEIFTLHSSFILIFNNIQKIYIRLDYF